MSASSPPRPQSSPHLLATSTPIECLRDWVHATNKGAMRRLSAWWTRSDSRVAALSSKHAVGSTRASGAPAPAIVAAICALDTEDQPLDCASLHHYMYYDSDEGESTNADTNSKNDRETQLELLRQLELELAHRDSDDTPLSSSTHTVYCKYASHKSGVGA